MAFLFLLQDGDNIVLSQDREDNALLSQDGENDGPQPQDNDANVVLMLDDSEESYPSSLCCSSSSGSNDETWHRGGDCISQPPRKGVNFFRVILDAERGEQGQVDIRKLVATFESIFSARSH